MIRQGIAPCLGTGDAFVLDVFFFIRGAAIQDEWHITPLLPYDWRSDSFLKQVIERRARIVDVSRRRDNSVL